jgi:hypothetical protein
VVRRPACRFAVGAAAVMVLGLSLPAGARSANPVRRSVAQVSGAEARRVVVSEGEGKTARLLSELEQELKASSYVVIRVPKVAFEPEAMLKTLQDAQASRGILLSDDGKTVMVLAATPTPGSLRVYAEYSLNHENRLARRRQWIALVERMRVSMEEEQNAERAEQQPDEPSSETNGSPWRTADLEPIDLAEPSGETPAERRSMTAVEQASDGLGASVALGYITGRTGLTSHLLLNGHHHLTPRISLAAQVLWPLVQGERSSDARVWSFIAAFGLMAEPARPSARVNPYLGLTVGMQFLLAYVDRYNQAITDVYRVASLTLDSQLGIRVRIHASTWLVIQASVGRAIALSTESGEMTRSLADTWGFRTAVGLLMAL